jgi:uncharacterized protein (TIGR03437 family)
VVNAASNIPSGLPNAGIAQGAIFIVYGSNLGPSAISISPAPFQNTSLAGTSVTFTSGGVPASALMYYTSAGQVAALLPSNAAVGRNAVVVTYNNQASAEFIVNVVANNLGIFTITSDGQGTGIVTFPDYSLVSAFKAANCGGPGTTCGAANPGDTLSIWATGLGPVNGSDAAGAGLGVNMTSVPLKLWMGGVQAPVLYQGRSCCIGEDQIVFTVPANVPTGCSVPLIAQIGNQISNGVPIAVASGSRSCTPVDTGASPAYLQALAGSAPFGYAQINLEHKPNQNGSGYVDTAYAQFQRQTEYPSLEPYMISSIDVPPIGTCQVYNNPQDSTDTPFASALEIDAGASLTVKGPAGSQSVPEQMSNGNLQGYSATLSANGSYLQSGLVTVTGPGGADVGPFSVSLNMPPQLVWTNQGSLATVNRASGLTVNWTGGSTEGFGVVLMGQSATDSSQTTGASFFCLASATAGTFTIPPSVLLALPAGSYASLTFVSNSANAPFISSGLVLGEAMGMFTQSITTTFQ